VKRSRRLRRLLGLGRGRKGDVGDAVVVVVVDNVVGKGS
jgi:hypothetical protein